MLEIVGHVPVSSNVESVVSVSVECAHETRGATAAQVNASAFARLAGACSLGALVLTGAIASIDVLYAWVSPLEVAIPSVIGALFLGFGGAYLGNDSFRNSVTAICQPLVHAPSIIATLVRAGSVLALSVVVGVLTVFHVWAPQPRLNPSRIEATLDCDKGSNPGRHFDVSAREEVRFRVSEFGVKEPAGCSWNLHVLATPAHAREPLWAGSVPEAGIITSDPALAKIELAVPADRKDVNIQLQAQAVGRSLFRPDIDSRLFSIRLEE